MSDYILQVFEEDDETLYFEVGTSPSHPNPFLQFPEEGTNAEINPKTGAISIGRYNLRIIDPQTGPTQSDRFLTELLGSPDGYSLINGHRCVFKRDTGELIMGGICAGSSLLQSIAGFEVSIEDIRARSIKIPVFSRSGTSTVLPRGVLDGYGRIPVPEPTIPVQSGWMIPPTHPIFSGQMRREVGSDVGFLSISGREQDAIARGYLVTDAMRSVTTPVWDAELGKPVQKNIEIWWQEAPGEEWNILSNMPDFGYGYAGTNTVAGLFHTWSQPYEGAFPIESLMLSSTPTTEIPANLQQVRVMIVYVGPPTDEYPFHFEGTAGTLLRNVLRGDYSFDEQGNNIDPKIPYDESKFVGSTALPALQTMVRLRIFSPEEDMREWLVKASNQLGIALGTDDQGRVVPLSQQMPDPSVELLQIDDTNAQPLAGWEHPISGAITQVDFQYPRDFRMLPQDDPGGYKSTGDGIYTVNQTGSVKPKDSSIQEVMGVHIHKLDGFLFRAVGGSTGQPISGDAMNEDGAKVSIARGYELLDRFSFGGQSTFRQVLSESVPGLKIGDWVIDGVSWEPNYSTGKRGRNHLSQVVNIRELNSKWIGVRLVDSAPYNNPVAQPTLGTVTADSGGVVSVPVTALPAGVEAQIEYAISDVVPNSNSSLWTFLDRTDALETITSQPLPLGSVVWIRARGKAIGKRPSAWTTPVFVTISGTPRITTLSLWLEEGEAHLNWEVNGFVEGIRVYYEVHSLGSAPTDLEEFYEDFDVDEVDFGENFSVKLLIPVVLPGKAITISAVPYSGIVGGEVTGTAGHPIVRSVDRPGAVGFSAEYASDALGSNASTVFDPGIHTYWRISSDGGVTWTDWVKFVAEDGDDGASGEGQYVDFVFKVSTTQPSTPTGSEPVGWSDFPPAYDPDTGNILWFSRALKDTSDDSLLSAWSTPAPITGPTGATGPTGPTGPAGPAGINTATVFIFRRSATVPALPDNSVTYTFLAASITGSLDGWSQTVPAANGNPLWVSAATASGTSTTDSIAPGEWATPVIMSQDGATGSPGSNGVNSATIYLFQRAASSPAVPASSITYTFATGATSGSLGSWSRTVPAHNGNPLWVTTATALGTGATDSIAAGEWATPQIYAQDGATGPAGLNNALVHIYRRAASVPAVPDNSTTYTFATGILSGSLDGWSQSVPAANGNPLWVSVATASSTGTTDAIGAGEWATPVIMAQDGQDGADGTPGSAGTPGINAATVYLFRRSAASPTLPDNSITYTFATGVTTGSLDGWSRTFPAHDGNPLWVTTATALGTGASDTIGAGEWATPQVLAQDGATGPQGIQGIPGPAGEDGLTTYFHVAYADTVTGTGFSQSPTGKEYIGTYVDNNPDDSVTPSSYTWVLFKGAQGDTGEQGIPGTNGTNGQTSYLHIKYSDDAGSTFTASNGETPGKWIGQYVDFTLADSLSPSSYTWSKIRGDDSGRILNEIFTEIPPGISTSGVSIVPVAGTAGGRVLQVSGAYRNWYPDMARTLPFVAGTTYRLEARVRVTVDNTDASPNELFYAGIRVFDANGALIGTNRYILASAESLEVADGWKVYVAWLKGTGASISEAWDPDNPSGVASTSVAFISPMALINYSSPVGQVTQLDYFNIEAVATDLIDRVYENIDILEGDINDSISGGLDSAESRLIADNLNRLAQDRLRLEKEYVTVGGNSDLTGAPDANLDAAFANYDVAYDALVTEIINAIDDDVVDAGETSSISTAISNYEDKLGDLALALEAGRLAIKERGDLKGYKPGAITRLTWSGFNAIIEVNVTDPKLRLFKVEWQTLTQGVADALFSSSFDTETTGTPGTNASVVRRETIPVQAGTDVVFKYQLTYYDADNNLKQIGGEVSLANLQERTITRMVTPSDFTCETAGAVPVRYIGGIENEVLTSERRYTATVQAPYGSVISRIETYFYRSGSAGSPITVKVYKVGINNSGGGGAQIVTAVTNTSFVGGPHSTEYLPAYQTVPHEYYVLEVLMSITDVNTWVLILTGAEFEFTLPDYKQV